MPALNVWWRRWFIGSDDLPFVFICALPVVILWMIILPLWMAGLSRGTCQGSMSQYYVYGGCMIGLMCTTFFGCVVGIHSGSQGMRTARLPLPTLHSHTQVQCLRPTNAASPKSWPGSSCR